MIYTNLGYKCKYTNSCPLYKGLEKSGDTPLHILRNVFCNRGIKGWKNCSKYHLFEKDLNKVSSQSN